jgi:hypothetical protein
MSCATAGTGTTEEEIMTTSSLGTGTTEEEIMTTSSSGTVRATSGSTGN